MTSAVTRQSDGTIELTINVPWSEIAKYYNGVVTELVENAQLPGFRKGKAPRATVEKSLDKTKVYEEVLRKAIPKFYGEAISAQKLHSIVVPKIELKEAKEGVDWVIRALTCEKPEITLGDYKAKIHDLVASKAKKIWTPKDASEAQDKDGDKPKKPTLDEVLAALFTQVTLVIPALLLEQEVNRLLSDLIDQTKKLGLSVEQYLSSTHRTSDSVRSEYVEQARKTITLEFALEEISDKEGILVSDDDLEKIVKTAKTDDERAKLEKERYYLASILRRQKTLDFLGTL